MSNNQPVRKSRKKKKKTTCVRQRARDKGTSEKNLIAVRCRKAESQMRDQSNLSERGLIGSIWVTIKGMCIREIITIY